MQNGTDKCSDIDECKYDLMPEDEKCGANSQCNNLYGGFECECCHGYVWNPDTRDCDRKLIFISNYGSFRNGGN